MKQDAFIKEVAQHIVKERLTPFIGAGLSCNAGYPSWKKLIESVLTQTQRKQGGSEIEKIIDEVNKKISSGHFQDAADFFANNVPDYQRLVCDEIKKSEETDSVRKASRNIKIDRWFCNTIITTNYDNFIEYLYTKREQLFDSVSFDNLDEIISLSDKTKIIHLHGSIRDPKSIVFSQTDIKEKIWDQQFVNTYLKSIFLLKTILFIGYGIKDSHIETTLKNFNDVRKNANISHYAILTASEAEVINWEKMYKLSILRLNPQNEYKSEDGDNLIEIISKITQECDRIRSQNLLSNNVNSSTISNTINKLTNLVSLQQIHLSIESLLALILKKGLDAIDKDRKTFTIHLVEHNKMRVIASGGENIDQRKTDDKPRSSDSGLTGKVYTQKLPSYYAPDVSQAHGYIEANKTTKSEFILPLKDKNSNYFGVLNFESSEYRDFEKEETREVLACVAQHISIALQNKKKYDLNQTAIDIYTEVFDENYQDFQRDICDSNKLKDSFEELIKKTTKVFLFFTGNSFSSCLFAYSKKDSTKIVSIARQGKNTFDELTANLSINRRNLNDAILDNSFVSVNNKEIYWHLKGINDHEFYYFLHMCFDEPYINTNDEFTNILKICVDKLTKNIQFIKQGQKKIEIQKELNLLKEIISLPENLEKSRFLNSVAEKICYYLDVDWCFIYMYDTHAKYFKQTDSQYDLRAMKFAKGDVSIDEFDKTSYTPGEGLIGAVITSRDFIESTSFSDERRINTNRKVFEVRGINDSSFLGYPIKDYSYDIQENYHSYDDILGVITIGRISNHFELEDRDILKKVSTLVGNKLKSRWFLNSHVNFKSYINLLEKLPIRLVECNSEDEIFTALSEFIPSFLDEQYYSIFKLDEENILRMVSPKKYLELDNNPPTFKQGEGLTGKIIDKGYIFELNLHEEGHPECKKFWTHIIGTDDRYFMGVPIKYPNQEKFYGVITLNGRKPEAFDPVFYEEITLKTIKSIASQITLALSNLPKIHSENDTKSVNVSKVNEVRKTRSKHGT
jgi:hypothetical protein